MRASMSAHGGYFNKHAMLLSLFTVVSSVYPFSTPFRIIASFCFGVHDFEIYASPREMFITQNNRYLQTQRQIRILNALHDHKTRNV